MRGAKPLVRHTFNVAMSVVGRGPTLPIVRGAFLRNRNGKAERNNGDDFAGKREDDRGWRDELARMRHRLTDRAVRWIVIGGRVLLRRTLVRNFRWRGRFIAGTQAESL